VTTRPASPVTSFLPLLAISYRLSAILADATFANVGKFAKFGKFGNFAEFAVLPSHRLLAIVR